MALPLTSRDKDLLLSAFGLPETRDRVVALLDLAGTGNMTGPGSATDNALVRFDGTTGALVQNSGIIVDDSNNISGVGSFAASGAFLAPAGSAAAPSHSFSADPNTGMFNRAADELGFSLGGVEQLFLQTGFMTAPNARTRVSTGTPALPGYSFAAQTDMGMFRGAATELGFTVSGSEQFRITNASIVAFQPHAAANGTAALPSYAFNADPDTGAYSIGANQLGFATSGVLRFSLSTTAVTSTLPVAHSSGNAAAPGITFSANLDMGFFRGAATEMDASVGGLDVFRFATTAITSFQPHYFQDGSAAAPSISFNADQNSGLYRVGADNIALVTNGLHGLAISSTQQVTLGTNGTPVIHRVNGTLQAPAAGVLTLTNGPGASTGNPTAYVTFNFNGTNLVVPAWAF